MGVYLSGIQVVALEEGKRNKAYKDSRGIWTIGLGYNLIAHGYSEEDAAKQQWSDEQVYSAFAGSILRCVEQLNDHWPSWTRLDEVRQAVCLSSVYQLGSASAAKFISTIDALEDGDYERAAKQILLSRWAKQTPARVKRNSEMLRTGEWPLQINGTPFEVTEGCVLDTSKDIVEALTSDAIFKKVEKRDTTSDQCLAPVLPPERHGNANEKSAKGFEVVRDGNSSVQNDKTNTPTIRIPNILGVRISKKMSAALIGVAIILLNHPLGLNLTPSEIDAIKMVIMSFIVTQGGVDLGGPSIAPILKRLAGVK